MNALLVACGGVLALAVYLAGVSRALSRAARILIALRDHGPQYGLDLRERCKLGSSTYITLSQLEDLGLIVSWEVPGTPERGMLPRRLYRLVTP